MNWPNLPEDYGEGQRQFDMAQAALSAAKQVALFASFGLGAVATFFVGVPWAYVFFAPAFYGLLTFRYRQRVKMARKAWVKDVTAYQAWLDAEK